MNIFRKFVLAVAVITVIAAVGSTIALASVGSLTTTTVLGHRAVLAEDIKVHQDQVRFQTKDSTDVLIQTITFQPHGNSGWHYHPGVVIVVVESGHVTTHNANCDTVTYGPHQAFVESGTAPFMVSNESATENAVVYATLVVPTGKPFRIETAAPACA